MRWVERAPIPHPSLTERVCIGGSRRKLRGRNIRTRMQKKRAKYTSIWSSQRCIDVALDDAFLSSRMRRRYIWLHHTTGSEGWFWATVHRRKSFRLVARKCREGCIRCVVDGTIVTNVLLHQIRRTTSAISGTIDKGGKESWYVELFGKYSDAFTTCDLEFRFVLRADELRWSRATHRASTDRTVS